MDIEERVEEFKREELIKALSYLTTEEKISFNKLYAGGISEVHLNDAIRLCERTARYREERGSLLEDTANLIAAVAPGRDLDADMLAFKYYRFSGLEGLRDLLAFAAYCDRHKMSDQHKAFTVIHDVLGRDTFPRTNGFAKRLGE